MTSEQLDNNMPEYNSQESACLRDQDFFDFIKINYPERDREDSKLYNSQNNKLLCQITQAASITIELQKQKNKRNKGKIAIKIFTESKKIKRHFSRFIIDYLNQKIKDLSSPLNYINGTFTSQIKKATLEIFFKMTLKQFCSLKQSFKWRKKKKLIKNDDLIKDLLNKDSKSKSEKGIDDKESWSDLFDMKVSTLFINEYLKDNTNDTILNSLLKKPLNFNQLLSHQNENKNKKDKLIIIAQSWKDNYNTKNKQIFKCEKQLRSLV